MLSLQCSVLYLPTDICMFMCTFQQHGNIPTYQRTWKRYRISEQNSDPLKSPPAYLQHLYKPFQHFAIILASSAHISVAAVFVIDVVVTSISMWCIFRQISKKKEKEKKNNNMRSCASSPISTYRIGYYFSRSNIYLPLMVSFNVCFTHTKFPIIFPTRNARSLSCTLIHPVYALLVVQYSSYLTHCSMLLYSLVSFAFGNSFSAVSCQECFHIATVECWKTSVILCKRKQMRPI